jgi:hypothetical protein
MARDLENAIIAKLFKIFPLVGTLQIHQEPASDPHPEADEPSHIRILYAVKYQL